MIILIFLVLFFLDKIAVYGFVLLAKIINVSQHKITEIKRINVLYVRYLRKKSKKNT